MNLETLAGRARWLFPPELVDQTIGGNAVLSVQDQQREQRRWLPAAEIECSSPCPDLDAAEDAKAVRRRGRRRNVAPVAGRSKALLYRSTLDFLPRDNRMEVDFGAPAQMNPREGRHHMSRTIVITSAAILCAALLAWPASGHPARPVGKTGVTACAPGSVRARIAGRRQCLRAGQRCRRQYDRQYHRYGFHCHTGRLELRLPSAGRIVATIGLEANPAGAVLANGALWVAEHNNGTIARIDPGTNRVVARVSSPSGQPARLAAGPEGLWHLPYSDNSLEEIDPATNQVSAHIGSIGEPDENCCLLAVGAGSVWVPKADDGVYRVDAKSRQVTAHIAIDKFFGSVFGLGSLWGISGGDVFRVDPAANAIAARIAVPGLAKFGLDTQCCAVPGVGAGAVWIGMGKKVVRIDPTANAVAPPIRIPGTADLVTVTDDSVWVVGTGPSPGLKQTLWRIDPTANKVVAALSLGTTSQVADLVFGAGSLWITLFRQDKLLRVVPAGR
jgi:DNA-binding beta-propeller fold protein YncE